MDAWINDFFKYVTSIAVAAAVVGFIAREALKALFKADLERFKVKLEAEAKSDERIRREIIAWANPIQDAALSLERRLDNILNHEGYKALQPGYTTADWSITYDYFLSSTLYLFGQYFCWIQMLRLELSFELFRSQQEKVSLFEKIDAVSKALGDFDPPIYPGTGSDAQVFRLQQQAIGELIVFRRDGKRACRGYAYFISKLADGEYQKLFGPVFVLVDRLGIDEKRAARLRVTQAALAALIAECGRVLRLPDKPARS